MFQRLGGPRRARPPPSDRPEAVDASLDAFSMDSNHYDDSKIQVLDDPGRYAVLLNALAKGWSGELHQEIQDLVPGRDLYLTDDLQQAERTIDTLLERDYDILFTGGGDGTVMFLVNALERRIASGRLDREEAPPVGVLRMGSGNAIATYLGTESATTKLRALRAGSPVAIHSMNMIRSDDGLFPFAGIGWDAEILNDYEDFKETVRETAVEDYATGLSGYVAAIATRTLPRVVRQNPVRLTVRNRGERAMKVDAGGDVVETYGPGDVLYDGPVRTCATASVSYWGYGIRMFPYATLKWGCFMLRCFDGTVGSIIRHLPSFWRGRFPEGNCTDFLVEDVHVETQGRAMAYQVTGEGAGYERNIDWRVTDQPVRLAVPLH